MPDPPMRDPAVVSIIEASARAELEVFDYSIGGDEPMATSVPHHLFDRPLHLAGLLAWKTAGARRLPAELSH